MTTTAEWLERLPRPGPPGYDPDWDEIRADPVGYFSREGEPITMRQWCALHGEFEYCVVAKDDVFGYSVSTVWLGLNHAFGPGPLIFETMVFEREESWSPPVEASNLGGFELPAMPGFWYRRDFETRRYSTEEAALAGHRQLCEEVRLTAEATSEIPGWPKDEGGAS